MSNSIVSKHCVVIRPVNRSIPQCCVCCLISFVPQIMVEQIEQLLSVTTVHTLPALNTQTNMVPEAKIAHSIEEDLTDSSDFNRYFTFGFPLGEGSDGEVSTFLHRPAKRLITVKIPRTSRISASVSVLIEAKALKVLGSYGKHENINHMISYRSTYGITIAQLSSSIWRGLIACALIAGSGSSKKPRTKYRHTFQNRQYGSYSRT
jgi:hypothetical protein